MPSKDTLADMTVRRNLFKIPGSFKEMEITFLGSSLPAVFAPLAIRTRGLPFVHHAHMGGVLRGQVPTQI